MREAKMRREQVRDGSDDEFFAKAYKWWGRNLQSHVLGEYAVCVADQTRPAFLLTHDALGLVPIFYSRQSNKLRFATHLDDLVCKSEGFSLDEEYIADYICTANVISSRTPYSGIHRIMPGQSLEYINDRFVTAQTWDISDIPPITLGSDEEYEEHFRYYLCKGVEASLVGAGNTWCELSGGLDSSTIVSVASRKLSKRLNTVSVVYSDSESADESDWMKTVVSELSLPWYTIDADKAKPYSELPQHFCAEPLNAIPNAGLIRRYNKLAVSNDIDIILSGHGGDQVFLAGSPRPYYLPDLLPFHPLSFFRELNDWRRGDLERRSLLYHFRKSVYQPQISHWNHRSLFSSAATIPPAWIRPEYATKMNLMDRAALQTAPKCNSVGQQYIVEMIWRTGFPVADDTAQVFEYRHPLLYRELVEFMLAIPWRQRLSPVNDRYLHRRAMQGVLPEPIRQRVSKGEPSEAEIEGLRSASPWITLLHDRPRVVELGYMDSEMWEDAVVRAKYGRIGSMRHFIATATLEVWLRQFDQFR
jgi:asparagine synthase (glutamine-hydrolysing)